MRAFNPRLPEGGAIKGLLRLSCRALVNGLLLVGLLACPQPIIGPPSAAILAPTAALAHSPTEEPTAAVCRFVCNFVGAALRPAPTGRITQFSAYGPTAEPPPPAAAAEVAATATQIFLPLITRSPTPPPNLLANGDFERGNLDGWEANGATLTSDPVHGGRWAARLANTRLRTSLATTPGQTYKVTAWVRFISETGSDWGGFYLSTSRPDWSTLAEIGSFTAATHGYGWFKVALTFTAVAARTPLDIGYFGGPGRQQVAVLDDVHVFVKGANQAPIVTASLTPSAVANAPQRQTFTLTADDVDGAIVRVLWDFGDGGRSLAWSGERRVALPGAYTAVVALADDDGAVVTRTLSWMATARDFPTLTIDSPANDETQVSTPALTLRGRATGAIQSVTVSSDRGALATAQGTTDWSVTLSLQPGLNRVLAQAQDTSGRIVTQERRVRYVPAGPLTLTGLNYPATVERWEALTLTFKLENSAATFPHLPYANLMPPGLEWLDGVSVDALFTPDNWVTVYRRPAFLYQPYQRALQDNTEWLYPQGEARWQVRFAPPSLGTWRFRLEASEAKGRAQSPEGTFTVTAASQPNNRGPVRVAPQDSRYFEYADGAPFLGVGHGFGFSSDRFSYEAAQVFDRIGLGNQNFLRWWVSGGLWASAWQPWRSRTLNSDGYVPASGLTLERGYGHRLAALQLDSANPLMFQGFDSGQIALIPGRTYRLMVRWRTEQVTGPAIANQPYGATVKLTGWPEPGQTGSFPAIVRHVHGDTPWHVATGDFTAAGNFAGNLALILENVTGGAAYVDAVTLREVLPGGELGPQLLRGPQFNSHLTFDPARAFGIDVVLDNAEARGLAFKLVISEKDEYLLNHLGPEGLPERNGGQFDHAEGTPGRWLHQAYWRYLFARFGAYRSVHSWELANEAAPSPGAHFRLAADLAQRAAADGNPHPASTSTWATLAEAAWKTPDSTPISYTDFHAYVFGTGWLGPKAELAGDTARLFAEYDRAALAVGFGKPVIWGELGIDGGAGTDFEEPLLAQDTGGVWLHKLTWARTGPGGVYPLYWYTDNIFNHSLHPIFGAWRRFMEGIPLTNGRYRDAAASASSPNLRVLGQKDVQAGWAHLWIDNRTHTWRSVVERRASTPLSGTVSVDLQRPGATYTVVWYDTRTGQPSATQTLTANAAGVLSLTLNNLATDIAVRITR